MKILMFLIAMSLSVFGQGVRENKYYPSFGKGKVVQRLAGGFIVKGLLKGEIVYVEDHRLWKSGNLAEGDKISIRVKRDGFYSYTTVLGAEKHVKKYLYRGEKGWSKIKKASDKQVF